MLIPSQCPDSTRSRSEYSICETVGLMTNTGPLSVWMRPTRTVAIGPSNGAFEIARAHDAAVPASTSESFSPSWLITQHCNCTSSTNPSGNSGRIGRSIIRIVRISFSFGAPSRLRNPPGNLPAAAVFSR